MPVLKVYSTFTSFVEMLSKVQFVFRLSLYVGSTVMYNTSIFSSSMITSVWPRSTTSEIPVRFCFSGQASPLLPKVKRSEL